MVSEEGTSNGNGTEDGHAIHCDKNGGLTNGFGFCDMNYSADPSSGESKDLKTYKRRRHGRSSSESKLLECGGKSLGAANNLAGQESDACELDRGRCHSEERQLRDGIQLSDKPLEVVSRLSTTGPPKEVKCCNATAMCQRVLSNILASEEFASLSNLLSGNFQGIRVESLASTSLINSRMKEGVYKHSPVLFSTDIQEVWEKFQSIGNEMVSLAKNLSDLSRSSYGQQFHTWESDSHAKSENPAADSVYGICTCKLCGENAEGRHCLVCDYCEDTYHVSCIQPAVKEIPKRSWYCLSCTCKGIGSPHENCVVCERLNVPRTQMSTTHVGISMPCEEIFNEVEEKSSRDMDSGLHHSEGKNDSEICRVCGSEVENGGRFITCDHPYCPHKYYHVRCLTKKQLKLYGPKWYCPSCLCRDCLADKDDDKIVLCDGCDEAYHIYCMKPPRASIPEGKWFCRKCEVAIQQIHRAKRAYEKINKLSEQGIGQLDKGGGGMDMLLNAANTLNHQEHIAVHHQMKD